jgi:hypothetical protein
VALALFVLSLMIGFSAYRVTCVLRLDELEERSLGHQSRAA